MLNNKINKINNKNNIDDKDSSKRQDDSDMIAMKNKLIDSYKSAIFDKNQLATMKDKEQLSDDSYTGWVSSMIVDKNSPALGINSRVSEQFFWGDGFTKGTVGNELYDLFKQYVIARIDKKEINIEAGLKSQIDELEKTLTDGGLLDVKDSIELLRPKIRDSILKDMDRHKKYITDGVELAILSTELPSRLVVYHTVLQDEQVHSALQLLSGEGVPLVATSSGMSTSTSSTSSSSGVDITTTTTNSAAKKKLDGSGEISKLTYDSLLQAQITTADATN